MALAKARSGSNSLGRAISALSSLHLGEIDRPNSRRYSLESAERAVNRWLHGKIVTSGRKSMRVDLRLKTGVFLGLLLAATVAAMSPTKSSPDTIESRFGEVDGIKIHYLTAGHGPAVILLHGYTQTSRMWRPIIPLLAKKFTVIAPDLPGIGDSAIPKDGLDMKTSAIRIHALAKLLGIEKARVVGHDIGLMVAYAYAALFPAETEKLAVLDAFLPGVAGWEAVYDDPNVWHFRFHGPTPEALVSGRERTYFAYFWNDLAADKDHSLPVADREAYVAAYS